MYKRRKDMREEQRSGKQARSPPMGVPGSLSLQPELSPSDFYLFERRTWKVSISEPITKFSKPSWRRLHDLDTDFSSAGFDTLVYERSKCFGNHSGYVEK
ncbi:hypothetical protein AVEN_207965-1 [Araneus ventricosus]|uniref:Uncharacterized protein n=1 Tax=Araneus ventricosus TaxID=182803 RepID=A0A4Y2MKD0_ARAVE|nr:hypothetical protein AVEN_207965-1 [Araneus ventricosus]